MRGFAPDGAGGLAKLRLARWEGDKLVYAGRVGTGWDHKTAREIRSALAPLARTTSLKAAHSVRALVRSARRIPVDHPSYKKCPATRSR